jgi:RNA-binding motif X-linked protein 2
MNQIRAIQALNKREIENGVPPEASWHADYRDTAFVYFGGLPYELSEGDVITIFSQFGEPVFLKLARDKETGKSKGFGWLKYEDQRSTDLAVDNLGGTEIGGRLIRVDHARYKMRDDEDLDEYKVGWEDMLRRERAEKGLPSGDEDETDEEQAERQARPMIKEERELQSLIQNHDDEDPMKEFLIEEKKKEVEEALRREKRRAEKESRKHRDKDRHRHRSHRSKRDDSDDEGRRRDSEYRDRDADRKSRSKRDDTPVEDRDEHDERRRRRRNSPDRDRHREERHHRDRERREDRRRRDDRSDDDDRRDRDKTQRGTREDSRDRGERRPRDIDDGRRRDRDRSRSRSPRSYRS